MTVKSKTSMYDEVSKHFATHGVLPVIEPKFLQELFDAAPRGSELEDALDVALEEARVAGEIRT